MNLDTSCDGASDNHSSLAFKILVCLDMACDEIAGSH